ncbi:hypothetical protein V2J09_007990 [Rumex salicifolius]
MSEYSDVVAGKLRLKGKSALDVKSGGLTKKKKHTKQFHRLFTGSNMTTDLTKELSLNEHLHGGNEETDGHADDRLTPAEKRYLDRWQQIERRRLAKNVGKSHRDRIQEFNRYLANLTEHYDIPKVGPG